MNESMNESMNKQKIMQGKRKTFREREMGRRVAIIHSFKGRTSMMVR
jgi:hypothetical protein